MRRVASHAPEPASANCASDSWPAKPVTTVSDSTMIPTDAVVIDASRMFVGGPAATNTAVADRRRALDGLAAQRQRPPPHDQHEDDHEERHGPPPTGEGGRVGHLRLDKRDLGLEDPDREATRERQAE